MKRTSRINLLSQQEKVLLHLVNYQRYSLDADVPKEVTQDGIGAGVGIGRNNVNKLVSALIDLGYVEVLESRHVKGLPNVRKVYFLTQKGFEEALALKKSIEPLIIRARNMEGKEVRIELGRLGSLLPNKYTLVELANAVERGRFDAISFHEARVKEERRFVDYTDRKPTVRAFFGRRDELKRLNDLTDSPTCRLIVVQGIAGIGKTTLLAKFAQDRREKSNIFWFRIHEWVNLKGLLRPVAEFLSEMRKKGLEGYLAQTETPTIGEVTHLLETELKDTSAVLILDDLQKADRSLTDLLAALVVTFENNPALKIICTTREAVTFYKRSAVVNGVVQEIILEGLDRESSLQLMRSRSLPEESLDKIFRVTNGHPFFMELVEDPSQALGKNMRMFIEQEVYSNLEISEKRILEIASVFRYPVPTDSFFTMEEEIARQEGRVRKDRSYGDYMVDYDTIEALIRKSLLSENLGRMVGVHDVMREFFYSRLSPRQRATYHRAASKYYLSDESAPSKVEALYHCMMAGEFESAMGIAAANGREIVSRGYANLLSPLLAGLLKKDVGGRGERLEVLLLRAEILDIEGEWLESLKLYTELLEKTSPDRDRRLMAEIYRRLGVLHLRRFEYEEADAFLDQSLETAEMMGDSHTLTLVHYDKGGLAEREGYYQEAIIHFTKAEELARSIGDDIGRGKALYGIGRTYGQLRDLEKSTKSKREALDVLERTGDSDEIAKVCASLGNDLRDLGDAQGAVAYLEKAVELANSVGDLSTLCYALSNLAASYIDVGELDKADSALNEANLIATRLEDRFIIAASHLNRGYLYNKQRNWEWAKMEFAASLETLKAANSPLRLCHWMCEIGKVYCENSDPSGARELFEGAMAIAAATGHEGLIRDVDEMRRAAKVK
ncbi:MAG: AAA family ATPase [Methanomassiliicoccales archaeon]|nr:AAA family ATPase [Methanomassiliicoccales archaeon]